jgi:hypothetical protein
MIGHNDCWQDLQALQFYEIQKYLIIDSVLLDVNIQVRGMPVGRAEINLYYTLECNDL